MSRDSNSYTSPQLRERGSVASVTQQNDKIGTVDDGLDIQGLDGDIQPNNG
jgi:hypothetical protein